MRFWQVAVLDHFGRVRGYNSAVPGNMLLGMDGVAYRREIEMRQVYKVTGMNCNKCVQHVAKALQSVPGVTHTQVTLEPPQAVVDSEGEIDPAALQQAVKEAGDYTIHRPRL